MLQKEKERLKKKYYNSKSQILKTLNIQVHIQKKRFEQRIVLPCNFNLKKKKKQKSNCFKEINFLGDSRVIVATATAAVVDKIIDASTKQIIYY